MKKEEPINYNPRVLETNEPREIVNDTKINKEMEEIIKVLDKLNKDRFSCFESWRDLLFIFVNENWNISIFDKYVSHTM